MSAPAPLLRIVATGIVLACAGCGFKGPLYLPERNATVVTHPAAATQSPVPQAQQPAPAAKQKDKSSQGSPPSPQTSPPPQSPPQ